MGVKITGIDKLQKQLKEVEEAAETLNGSYPVSFDANDPVRNCDSGSVQHVGGASLTVCR